MDGRPTLALVLTIASRQ